MIAREAVLCDPEVVKLLSTRFVPLAVDNVGNPNVTSAEGEWLKTRGGSACTQGMSVFTAGGALLGQGGGFQPGPVKEMLQEALAKFKPEPPPAPEKTKTGKDSDLLRRSPEGGLVLYVTWKVLWESDRPKPPFHNYEDVFADSLGVDRLWVRRDEAEALARGVVQESLKRRMAGSLGYYVEHELHLESRDGRMLGRLGPATSPERSSILGFVQAKEGKVCRFDVVVRGPARWADDHGFSAPLTVAPKGKKVTLATAFTLADPKEDLARVYPHAARGDDYLR